MAAPTRDFAKRPKAKVGKRAPSKVNATDTAFKTARVAGAQLVTASSSYKKDDSARAVRRCREDGRGRTRMAGHDRKYAAGRGGGIVRGWWRGIRTLVTYDSIKF